MLVETLGPVVRVRAVKPLRDFWLRLTFADGTQKDVDLEPCVSGRIFEPIRNDPPVFGPVKIEGGTVAWDNGADIGPDIHYYGLKPAWMAEPEVSA